MTLLDTKQRIRHQRGFDRIFYASPSEVREILMVRGGAGSYVDAPARRMALHDDGSIGGKRQASNDELLFEFSGANMATMQNEDLSSVNIGGGSQSAEYVFIIFPELREFDGIFLGASQINIWAAVHSSGDSTNTFDGTFTQRISNFDDSATGTLTAYRTEITSLAVSNVRMVRANYASTGSSKNVVAYHIYGEISAAESPDRLLWFDDDDDLEFSKPQDYGDKPRGSAEDHIVYLKNNSASLSANSVQVTAQDLFGGSGGWLTFNDGTGFSSTKALASAIANGADSPNITIRVIRPDSAALNLHSANSYANVGSWT